MERCRAQAESQFVYRLQTVGGFGGKGDQLNAYNVFLGEPDYFDRDLARYREASAAALQRAAAEYLRPETRVVLSVVPQGPHRARARGCAARGGGLMAVDRTRLPEPGPPLSFNFPGSAPAHAAPTACASAPSNTTKCRSSPVSC